MMIFKLTTLKKTATVSGVRNFSCFYSNVVYTEDTESKICDCNFSYGSCYNIRYKANIFLFANIKLFYV